MSGPNAIRWFTYKYDMRKWISLIEQYTSDNSHVLSDLKNTKFDPYSFWDEVKLWAEEHQYTQELFGVDDLSEEDPEIFFTIPKDEQDECEEWIMDYLETHAPHELPSSHFFTDVSKTLIPRQTWLIHYCDSPWDIAANGFKYGTWDTGKLGLTTYYKKSAKSGGGYNFAYEAGSRSSSFGSDKYGKHAVMFQNSGAKAWHSSDEEEQVIFWGPSVNHRSIVVLNKEYSDWHVMNRYTHKPLFTGEIDDVMNWVMKNHHQYRKVMFG